jgi:hypothetical protein
MFLKRVESKMFQFSAGFPATNDVASIKACIQARAYQLWFEKRGSMPAEDVDWLVDGRLMDQLKGLSRERLLRVNHLLTRNTGMTRRQRRTRVITFRMVFASLLPNRPE